jgi:hypothetical protein
MTENVAPRSGLFAADGSAATFDDRATNGMPSPSRCSLDRWARAHDQPPRIAWAFAHGTESVEHQIQHNLTMKPSARQA